jgi:prepilin-type N-terminal cleavage/methylation domain-containing protein
MIKKYKGFTLIELMVVVVILGILAVVVAPRIPDLVKKAREGATKGSLSTLRSTLNIYYSDTEGLYPATVWAYNNNNSPAGEESTVLSDALVPKYIKSIPAVKLPTAHATDSNRVYVYEDLPSIPDEGNDGTRYGWGYGSEYGSPSYGNIIVHCSHTDTGGTPWYSY